MLSRIANVAVASQKTSILFRLASTNAATPAASAGVIAKTNESNVVKSNSPPEGVRAYPHDAPERDWQNFPPFKARDQAGRTRAFIIPEEWCQALYPKTGVTGPYLLFWGAAATLISKEYYIASVDFGATWSFFLFCGLMAKFAGPKIRSAYENAMLQQERDETEALNATTKGIIAKIEEIETLKTLPEANALIHAAKKENVLLQLESEYRERMQKVYTDVKKRLDYQVAVQNAYKRIEREQAINYINGEVAKSIGPAQEKEAFQTGLEQLKALAKKHAGTI